MVEYLGVFLLFFKNFDFWGLGTSFSPKRGLNFWAAWRLQKLFDLAEIWHTCSLAEYLGVFILAFFCYPGNFILYVKSGSCIYPKNSEHAIFGYDETQQECCEWGNIMEQDCEGTIKFTSNTNLNFYNQYSKFLPTWLSAFKYKRHINTRSCPIH